MDIVLLVVTFLIGLVLIAAAGFYWSYQDSGMSWFNYKCLMLHGRKGSFDRETGQLVCLKCGGRFPEEPDQDYIETRNNLLQHIEAIRATTTAIKRQREALSGSIEPDRGTTLLPTPGSVCGQGSDHHRSDKGGHQQGNV